MDSHLARLVSRLLVGNEDRLRLWEPIAPSVRAAAHRAHVALLDAPVVANGRLELR